MTNNSLNVLIAAVEEAQKRIDAVEDSLAKIKKRKAKPLPFTIAEAQRFRS